jgi:tetratricopeptide (TPR) repeat protein
MVCKFSGAEIIVTLLFLITFNAPSTPAQESASLPLATSIPELPAPAPHSNVLPTRHASVVVRVLGESDRPLASQALVQLSSDGVPPVYAATGKTAKATFDAAQSHRYKITVSAAGYQTAQTTLETYAKDSFYQAIVRMAPDPTSPAWVSLPLEPAARNDAQHGLAELQAGHFQAASEHFDQAVKLAPQNAGLTYLLGVSLLKSNDYEKAQSYLQRAASLDPHNTLSLVALGKARLKQGDYAGAAVPVKRAISINPKNWGAHLLLGSIYLVQRQFSGAVQESQKALRLGKNEANGAELVLGEAQVGLGQNHKAQLTLTSFVDRAPDSPAVPVAKQLMTQLQSNTHAQSKQELVEAALTSADAVQVSPDVASAYAVPSWRPPGVDEERIQVATGVACPASTVLDGVMNRVDEFVTNVNRFAATEHVVHEALTSTGKVISTEKRKFDYVVSINSLPSGDLDVDESRDGSDSYDGFPDGIATLGLPSLALVFHQRYRSDYNFTCEGLGELHEHATWIVHFQQRADRPSRIRGYDIEGRLYPVALKGRAWIAADTFQVMRMEADLMSPVPKIKLRDEHQAIEYRPVYFEKSKSEMWLPASADLYFDFRHHKYHRTHTFDGYLLFSVTATEKIGMPKEVTQDHKP